jgi:magnesium chelatase family protein
MNPCRCGYLGDAGRECGRAPRCGEDYQNRVSGPVLDRIDLAVEVQPATAAELSHAPPGEPSGVIARRVAMARQGAGGALRGGWAAVQRGGGRQVDPACCRTRTSCWSRRWSGCACRRAAIPARCGWRRTIADLAGAETVGRVHIAEALAFRHRAPGR